MLAKVLNFMEESALSSPIPAKIIVGLGVDFFLQQLFISYKEFMAITAELAHLWEKEGKKHFQPKSSQGTETEEQGGRCSCDS